jgi:hypothetical protein
MNRLMAMTTLLGFFMTPLADAAEQEILKLKDNYLVKCHEVHSGLGPRGLTGPTGPTGPDGTTGPTGFLSVNYGSFYVADGSQVIGSGQTANVQFPNLLITLPVGISSTGTNGDTFYIDNAGFYTFSWYVTFTTDVLDTIQFLSLVGSSPNFMPNPAPFEQAEYSDSTTMAGTLTLFVPAGEQVSLVANSLNGSTVFNGAMSIFQVAP